LEVVRNYSSGDTSDINVAVNKEDLEILEKNFLSNLKEETKKKIILSPSEEISGGFTISFDSGKSCYDFTDKALAEYIGTYLKPKLNQILLEALKE
jgi:vacuolar-type H+-ATPase subunit E/Vma4